MSAQEKMVGGTRPLYTSSHIPGVSAEAYAEILATEPEAVPTNINWRRAGNAVFRRYFGRTDFGTEPHTYDELGARIVAEACADFLSEEYDRCNRLGLHDFARKADEASFELYGISEGDTPEDIAYSRECEDALEGVSAYGAREYGISQREFV